jgi:hypothetical protein
MEGDIVTDTKCWACGSSDLASIFRMDDLALSSLILMDTPDEARAFPRGDLELAVCRSCAFVFNRLFRPELVDYTMPYESSQVFSPRFRAFADELIDHLVDDYSLEGKEILEIGSGDSSFLVELCRRSGARGLAIDPTFDPDRIDPDVDIKGWAEFYDADHTHLTGDLICCRHTLEHVQPVAEFVSWARKSAEQRPGSVVFFEIPDTDRILEEGAFWDVYNEHCSYFTLPSLSALFRRSGFDVIRLTKGFDDQYLLLDAVVGSFDDHVDAEVVAELVAKADNFGVAANQAVELWRERIDQATSRGENIVLWGASSKAVAFLAAVRRDDAIAAAVDINPYKQNRYMPASGIEVIAPERLREISPGLVIIMNPIYRNEIGADLAAMGLTPEVIALGDTMAESSR